MLLALQGSVTLERGDPTSGAASAFPQTSALLRAQRLVREAAAGLMQYQHRKDLTGRGRSPARPGSEGT